MYKPDVVRIETNGVQVRVVGSDEKRKKWCLLRLDDGLMVSMFDVTTNDGRMPRQALFFGKMRYAVFDSVSEAESWLGSKFGSNGARRERPWRAV